MSKIFISYGRPDAEFVRQLAEKLIIAGHEIFYDETVLVPGIDWRQSLSDGLKSADAFIVLLSESSLSSQFVLMEIGTARAYASEIGKPIIIPIAIDEIKIPLALQDIQILMAEDRDLDKILNFVNRALSILAGHEAAKAKKAEEVAKKIESNAQVYIEEAVSVQKMLEERNRRAGNIWYFLGFAALLVGICFAIFSLQNKPKESEWTVFATLLFTNIVVIGFLGACSRYAFSLGKSYISESLKASDRIHAIAFGKFYLKAFGEKANWVELKEVFQHWNIDRASPFSKLDASQIDPQILTLIGRIASSLSPKSKEG